MRCARIESSTSPSPEDEPLIVIDGVPAEARGDIELRYANRSIVHAADNLIVEIVSAQEAARETVTMVTSDRGLIECLPGEVRIEGSNSFQSVVGW